MHIYSCDDDSIILSCFPLLHLKKIGKSHNSAINFELFLQNQNVQVLKKILKKLSERPPSAATSSVLPVVVETFPFPASWDLSTLDVVSFSRHVKNDSPENIDEHKGKMQLFTIKTLSLSSQVVFILCFYFPKRRTFEWTLEFPSGFLDNPQIVGAYL